MTTSESRGESWARDQLKIANIISFPEDWAEKDRSVSGDFLLDALQHPDWQESRTCFQLKNAVINTKVHRRYALIKNECHFENCEFVSDVELPHAHFMCGLRFAGCRFGGRLVMHTSHVTDLEFLPMGNGRATHFLKSCIFMRCSITGGLICDGCLFDGDSVSFNSVRVKGVANISKSTFAGSVNFTGFSVDGQFNATGAKFTSDAEEVSFVGAAISGGIILDDASFAGPINFRATKFGPRLQCFGAKFLNDTAELSLDSCKVAGAAVFESSVFAGSVDFSSARIEGDLSLQGAKFLNPKCSARFDSMTVENNVFLQNAVFWGSSSFISAVIGRNLIGISGQWEKESASLNLQGVKVIGKVDFSNACLMGVVDFSGAELAGQLNFEKTQLGNARGGVSLNGCKVARGAFFDEAVISGPLNLVGSDIGGQLGFRRTKFSSEHSFANLSNAKVRGDLILDFAEFYAPVSFVGAIIERQFRCIEAKFTHTPDSIDLTGIKVSASTVFWNTSFSGSVTARHALFAQNLSIAGSNFDGALDLRNSLVSGHLYVFSRPEHSTPSLILSTTKLSSKAKLSGFRFAGTDLSDNEGWTKWLKLASSQTSYEPDVYLTLEGCFRAMGRDDLADRVYFEMGNTQTRVALKERRFDRWLKGIFLRFLVGYGVYGWRLLFWIIPAPVILYLMCSCSQPYGSRAYLWLYAIDVFLPVDLRQMSSCNVPSWAIFVTEVYGWIITPILIAQLAGYLKKKETSTVL